jgi:transposase
MRQLAIADASEIILGLQDEIRRSAEARYDHRLHGVLLVAHGMSCPDVSKLLGDASRTVEYWIRGFERDGLAALTEGERPGRPRRLNHVQMERIAQVLREPPDHVGVVGLWDGKTLATFIAREFQCALGARQCQRVFRQLGFRLRKPRPVLARADPGRQAEHKKNSRRL